MDIPKLVFFLGAPRSGTTFLTNVFSQCGYVSCVKDSFFSHAMVNVISRKAVREYWDLLAAGFHQTVEDYIAGESRGTFAIRFLQGKMGMQEMFARVFRKEDPRIFLYSATHFCFLPEFLYKSFPEAKIIYIYRDGRDASLSHLETYEVGMLDSSVSWDFGYKREDGLIVPFWISEEDVEDYFDSPPYVRSVFVWKEMVSRVRHFKDRKEVKESNRFYALSYEDLAHNPYTVLDSIADFAGLEVTNAARRTVGKVHTDSIGKYLHRVPADVLEHSERVAKEELEAHGYVLQTMA